MFKGMRKQDRKMSDKHAIDLLKRGEYGILSTVGTEGYPYGVPLNYGYVDNYIYFHCAKDGYKLDNIIKNDKISFCVVGNTEVVPHKFTTKYESVIIFGKTVNVEEVKEKENGLLGILEKYSKDFIKEGKEYINRDIANTKVYKINIEHITGKVRI